MAEHARDLAALHARIDDRVAAIRAVRPDWPCRRGCDACCRSLARPLEATALEWERIAAALERLEPAARADVRAREAALLERLDRGGPEGPVACPYLDEREGACRVYEARPIACRTYGFFVDRDGPEHCAIIEEDLARRGEAGLVWGNASSLPGRALISFRSARASRPTP